MPSVYLHQFGTESYDELLKAAGYLRSKNGYDLVRPIGIKTCPSCGQNNLPEAVSCAHCKLLIDSNTFNELMKEQAAKEVELVELKEMKQQLEDLKARELKKKEEIDEIRKMQIEINKIKLNITKDLQRTNEAEAKEGNGKAKNDLFN